MRKLTEDQRAERRRSLREYQREYQRRRRSTPEGQAKEAEYRKSR